MGQYYMIAYKQNDKFEVKHPIIRETNAGGRKLCEHAFYGSSVPRAMAELIYKNKTRIMWIGDYAKESEVQRATNSEYKYEDVQGAEAKSHATYFKESSFNYLNKYLVNHSKKLYISYSEYGMNKSHVWSPIVLLTVLGNGRGGGDYCGTDQFEGAWVWDELSIEDECPENFNELKTVFFEDF